MEWKVIKAYAGRDVVADINPVIWLVINKPNLGLIWTDARGNVYHFNRKIARIPNYSARTTHKNLLAAAHDKLGLTGNLRKNVDNIIDTYADRNIRGRIVKHDIYVYSFQDEKLIDKAVQVIYDYIPEE